jgi:PAS domain S-box-containing protein
VVEDNPLTLKVARLALGAEGYLVLEATDGTEALRLVESEQPDLILQDLLLPDMDGFELVSRLRANPKTFGIPIIAFSGFLSRLEHGRAAAAGFSDFLPKPVEPSRLLEVVRTYLPAQIEPPRVGHLQQLLVVDDDPVQLKLARVLLSGLGYRVLTAVDGAEALEVLEKEPVEAILSDVLMPRVDGFRLCAEIRASSRWQRIPVVLVSSNYVEEADRQVAVRMGASAYVVRTPDLGEAVRALETALGQPASAPPPASSPSAGAHHERVILQLERHAAMNATYAHRSAMHASMLSVLAGVSEALIKSQSLEHALPDVLGSLLEACGVSHGAIFFQRHDHHKEMHLGASAGYADEVKTGLADFCGQIDVFERAAASLAPLLLVPSDPSMARVLALIEAECALLVPLVADHECLGILLLASNTRDLTEHDWIPFARTMAVQIGQALALSRAFTRLKASETRYRRVVENAGMGIFTLDEHRCVTDVNPAMERILQRSRQEVLGSPVDILVAQDDQQSANDAYTELLKKGRVQVSGRRIRRADGQISVCDIWVTRMEIDGVITSIGVAQDVTDKHRVEAELRLLQTLTLAASESPDLRSALGVVLTIIGESARLDFAAAWLPGGDGLECSQWWTARAPDRELFRPLTEPAVTRDEDFLSQVWRTGKAVWLPSLSDLLPARLRSAANLGLRGGLAVPVVAHEKVTAVLEFFYLESGRDERLVEMITGAAAQVGPVIARQRAQEALRLSEARFARLCEAGIIGVSVANLDGEVLEANDVYLQMLGRTREDLLHGRLRWADQIPPEWQAVNAASVARLRATGVAQPWEIEIQRTDGSRLAVAVAVAMLNDHQCISLTSDISERKRVEAALGLSEEQLRQAQKMEAVGRLAGGVAHDFNNLLSIILSYSELILQDLGPEDPMRADLREIQHAGIRGADLTRQLLMFSRQQVLVPVVLDLNDVLSDLNKMLQRILGADVTLLTIPGLDLAKVCIDRGSLEQIILNLTVNARDAMPTGGRLTLETADVYLDLDYAREHLGATTGPHVMLAVSDTGSGMDRDTQARIFEPFFTTKSAGQGTGLGLSTVFGIVQASGGSVWVYSEPQMGTAFKIYLPRAQAPKDGAPPVFEDSLLSPADEMPRGTEIILLVEDEEGVRAAARSILRKSGYTVIEADGAVAARLVTDDPTQVIDLLLTDVVMPGVSGPALAAQALLQRPGLRTLFMSGYTDDTIFRHGVLEARMAYLQKPITPQSLTRKVREVLDA